MSEKSAKETLGFQTEVSQLLHLMIHSLYSNKEIFLRELISNASDAVDKLRFEALAVDGLLAGDTELKVHIDVDDEAKTITITDNGIGMSRHEVIENLGTIAKSGTAQFLQQMSGDQKKDSALIGQFGVGFYSGFIVAKQMDVFTRRAGLSAEEAVHWSSAGEGDFSIEPYSTEHRGTKVVLHLRDDCSEFADEQRVRSIVTKYADHISIPVMMTTTPPP